MKYVEVAKRFYQSRDHFLSNLGLLTMILLTVFVVLTVDYIVRRDDAKLGLKIF